MAEALRSGQLAGDGPFARRCQAWLERQCAASRAFLAPSATSALELAALLLEVGPGDEVIMPSFTFVSTANAFALRGAVPVFVDVRTDTLNLDERLVDAAITARTKAIVPVHYAGVACEMDVLASIASARGIAIVEDAAQGIMAAYKGRPLGSLGDLGVLSFHATKNVISGEGGALLVNRPELTAPAEVIREKGTDRSRFLRGEVDKYTWRALGSSFLPGELPAAFLLAQLEHAEWITGERLGLWNRYHAALEALEHAALLRRPSVPVHCSHNAHAYCILLPDGLDRRHVLQELASRGIECASHFVPLHSSAAGARYGRQAGAMTVTDRVADRLLRLPLWVGLREYQERVVAELTAVLEAA